MRNFKILSLVILLSISISMVYAGLNEVLNTFGAEPNPMEKETYISLTMVKSANVQVTVETTQGEIVKTIFSGRLNAGNYEYNWDRADNNGIYVPEGEYNLVINFNLRYTSIKKTLILK